MSKMLKLQNWLNSETEKDEDFLKKEKQKVIREITSLNKEDIFKNKKQIKLTFWQKIKRLFF